MNKITVYRRLALLVLIAATPGLLSAQESGFADDFNTDDALLSVGSFDNASGIYSIAPIADGLRLETTSGGSFSTGSIFINATDSSDRFGIDVTHQSTSTLSGPDVFSTFFLEAVFHSDTDNSENEEGGRAGNIEGQMTYGLDGFGNLAVDYCVYRLDANGNELEIDSPGFVSCNRMDGAAPVLGQRHSMDIMYDRSNNAITFSFDDVSQRVSVPGEVFEPSQTFRRFQLYTQGEPVTSIATLHAIRLGDSERDFATGSAMLDRYQPLYDVNGRTRTASVSNGELILSARAIAANEFRNRLYLQNTESIDYIESRFALSADSELGTEGRVRANLELSLYNDQADGGVDGRLGDVEGFFETEFAANGRARIEYCLSRSDDADFNNRSSLLPEGRTCNTFPIRPSLGVFNRYSIQLDRDASAVVFRVDDRVVSVPVNGPFFTHSDSFANIAASPRDGANAVVRFDTLRTSDISLTDTEINAGQSAPTPFPSPSEGLALADSTISFPITDAQPLDFVDDFSSQSVLLIVDNNEDRGNYGYTYVDGAVQLEAAQTNPDNCCGDARVRVQEKSDFIGARVSLSSQSALALDEDADARIRVDGVFWNDIQDGGAGDKTGDIYAQLRLRLRGDGSREASFCLDRNIEGSRSEPVNIVDGENCGRFNTIPMLDTEYNMSLEIDRERAVLIATFADESREIAIGTPVYLPFENYKRVMVQHSGSSGRAVGRIYSISTASGTQSFSNEAPLIAPYRPDFDSQRLGSDVQVVNGRLRIDLDATAGDRARSRLVSDSPSQYVAAIISVSSESTIDNDEGANLGVGGQMYNDISDGGLGLDNAEGAVYAIIRLVFGDEAENYVEYCAFRSNTSNFSDASELIGGDSENCPRLAMVPQFDTDYQASVAIDRERGVLRYTLDNTVMEYTIATGIFTPHNYFNGVRADAFGTSRLVAFADDLAYSASPVPLVLSDTRIGGVPLSNPDTTSTPSTDGPGADPTTTVSGGGGGGCSISTGSGGIPFPLLAFAGLLWWRRRQQQ